ncbi:hypothetical protein EGY05_18000 [Chryseobacterium arthrosphaerae]|uniref:DUF5977 domain-containing protein n=1 Tax=Chryseobacterium arthrosphaerae TaxID=651561 RepID=UPI000F4D70A7|nr:DUF5977 domain-containing protein [Chryseobacterium arthrosphaerae]AYZ13716.1 hypothetical protein EGY05_18000 [Chryseobacterium arthrosphaerae]
MKNYIYKVLITMIMLFSANYKGQNEPIKLQKNDYLSNSDVNVHNGIPDISLPLFNIPALSNINIGISISYSAEGVSAHKMISDVGKGWSLQYGGSIFKNNLKNVNDYLSSDTTNESSSEIYYYSFLGKSGRFYIGKDQAANELIAVQLQPSINKIIITKNSGTTNKVSSFTIIDENGNSYLFDKINIDKFHFGYQNIQQELSSNTKVGNSAFLLSSITNNKNQQVATFEYETTTELVSQFIGTVQENKIKKINVTGYGSIEFKYKFNPAPHSVQNKGNADWYQVDKLILRDKNNNIINQYAFLGDGTFLNDLHNLDKNNNIVSKHTFEYNRIFGVPENVDTFGYVNFYDPCSLDEGVLISPSGTNPKTANLNSLKTVNLPTGGRIEYEFESNSIAEGNAAYNDLCTGGACYDYYDLDKVYTLNFDTNDPSINYDLNLPSGYKGNLYVKYSYSLYPYPPSKPGVSNEIQYDLLQPDGSVSFSNDYINPMSTYPCSSIRVFPYSGSKVFLSGARRGYGKLEFYRIKEARKHNNKLGYGLRIKSIKNYDAESVVPSKWVEYEYNKFSDPLITSGESIDEDLGIPGDYFEENISNRIIGYSNIKVTNKLDHTYIKYFFYNSDEIFNLSGLTYSFINFSGYLTRAGLMKKKEIYGNNNDLIQESEFSYQPEILTFSNIKYDGQPIKKVFIKKETKTIKDKIDGVFLTNTLENQYESLYNNVISRKQISYDGSVIESNFKYANEKNIQKLLNANIVSTPLETEVKNDGIVVGKSEVKLDNPSTLYPTSALTYNVQNQNSSKKITFNNYDDKGNLRETSAENGIPTATIWGYHQTQAIAKIVGAAYTDIANLSSVTAAVSASDADDDDSSNEAALILALDNMRKDIALKNYLVETYTYDPLVGVTSKTSANGFREIYVYDPSHRISQILDKDGKVLKKYDYHYSPTIYTNVEMGNEYITNKCSVGYLPNKYTYLVPAKKYFSLISQDDANQKALQDIQANGQNITNQNAGCTPLSCTISKGYDIAVLNSASLTMPNTSSFRLQMNFPYDSSLSWAIGQTVGKINGNCIEAITGTMSFAGRTFTYGNWKITIYPNGNIFAKLTTGSSSLPNGTIVNFDITFPISF